MNHDKGELQGGGPMVPPPESRPTGDPGASSDRALRLIYEGEGGQRLDRFLADHCQDLTRSQLKRLIVSGSVLLNGRKDKAGALLRYGDVLTVNIPASPPSTIRPEPIPLEIVYEDPWILVLDKPAGMVVHPAPGHGSGTLVNAILAHCPGIQTVGGPQRAGLVHRLDKDTSGVMVVAKTEEAHRHLARQFRDRTVKKEYIALVHGRVGEAQGCIHLPLGRDQVDRKRISPRTRKPKTALTRFQVLQWLPHCTLLRVRPETGRTHQIRVHLAAIHHPVVGDHIYGRKGRAHGGSPGCLRDALLRVSRQLLHAERLSFEHPKRMIECSFRVGLSSDLIEILRLLGMTQLEVFDSPHTSQL